MLDAEASQRISYEMTGAPVNVAEQHHVVARFHEGQDGRGDRRHTAREEERVFGSVERGHAMFHLAHGRVPISAILLPLGILVLSFHVPREIGAALERVGRSGYDGRRYGVMGALVGGARM